MLDLELNKLMEQIELEEAKKELCLISDRTKDFKKVEATILSPEFFAHKNKYTGWTITDKASGLSLKSNFNTLADAKDYLKALTTEELEKINKVKSTEKYKEQCRKLAAATIDNYELEEDLCCSVFEALEENSQESLFKYKNECRLYESKIPQITIGEDEFLQKQIANSMFINEQRTELNPATLEKINQDTPNFPKGTIKTLDDLYKYSVTTHEIKLIWYCPIHKKEFIQYVGDRFRSNYSCNDCAVTSQISIPEIILFGYLKQIFPDTIKTDTIIGKELDIYIPSINCAVEYDGPWHEATGIQDDEKDLLCKYAGITLIRIRGIKLKNNNNCKYTAVNLPKENIIYIKQTDLSEPKILENIIKSIYKIFTGNKLNIKLSYEKSDQLNIRRAYQPVFGLTSDEEKSLSKKYPDIAAQYVPPQELPEFTADKILPTTVNAITLVCPICKKEYITTGKAAVDTYNNTFDKNLKIACPECKELYKLNISHPLHVIERKDINTGETLQYINLNTATKSIGVVDSSNLRKAINLGTVYKDAYWKWSDNELSIEDFKKLYDTQSKWMEKKDIKTNFNLTEAHINQNVPGVQAVTKLLLTEPEFKPNFEYLYNYTFKLSSGIGSGEFSFKESSNELDDAAYIISTMLFTFGFGQGCPTEDELNNNTDPEVFKKVARYILNRMTLCVMLDLWATKFENKDFAGFKLHQPHIDPFHPAGNMSLLPAVSLGDYGRYSDIDFDADTWTYKGKGTDYFQMHLRISMPTFDETCDLTTKEFVNSNLFECSFYIEPYNYGHHGTNDVWLLYKDKALDQASCASNAPTFNSSLTTLNKTIELWFKHYLDDLKNKATKFYYIILPFQGMNIGEISSDECLKKLQDFYNKFLNNEFKIDGRLHISNKAVAEACIKPAMEAIKQNKWVFKDGDYYIEAPDINAIKAWQKQNP